MLLILMGPFSFSAQDFYFKQLSFLFIITLFTSPFSLPVSASSQLSNDRFALLAFKSQISDDPLGALSWWNDSLSHCHWRGIICTRGRVTHLNLPFLKLGGSLSPYIGNLAFLRQINLTENNFHGHIPSNITHSSDLRVINFIGNKLSGNIPDELSLLTKLEFLGLSENAFSGSIPSSLGNLSSLVKFSLQQNQLVGSIPDDLCHIQGLNFFQVGENNLTGEVPSCLYNLSNMYYFDVRSNQLEGSLPPNIRINLPNIQEFYLYNNNFNGTIPTTLFSAKSLQYIDLSDNSFSGEIPLFSAKSLQEIDLSDNSFSGEIPTNLTHCLELTSLVLSSNLLSGKIPSSLGNLSSLAYLYLDENNINGNIPSSLGNLSSLIELNLYDNIITGNIPSSLGNLSPLTILLLSANHLEGNIPDDLCHLQSLGIFQVDENTLTGTIPLCLYNHSNIYVFAVNENHLEGSLPPHMGITLPKIREVYLGKNKFNGLIPMSLTNATTLEIIDFSYNYFTGPIPRHLGRLHSLQRILFDGNNLGTKDGNDLEFIASLTNCSNLNMLSFFSNFLNDLLPESVSNLSTKLTFLGAGSNRIHGNIPVVIQNLANIEVLDLSDNYLSGNIPTVIGKLNNIKKLNFSSNMLSGPIPASLGNLTQLLQLTLYSNNFSGSIPPTLRNCKNLELLDLSNNKLVGKIPKELTSLSLLTLGLSLANNFLTGSLPSDVGNFTRIVTLNVSGNNLSGHLPETLDSCLSLEMLDIHKNLFEGEIPQSFSVLKGLQYFDLSQNNLSGKIPKYLEWFPLRKLNLSHNRFEGRVPNDGCFRNVSVISVVENKNLCGGLPEFKLPSCSQKQKKTSSSSKVIIASIVGCVSLLMFLCLLMICSQRKMVKHKESSIALFDPSYKRVSYSELFKATNGFAAANLIGIGSYGSVYKGILEHTNKIVAVKVLNLDRDGASKSFLTECNALRSLRHRNLLKIITSCASVDFQGNDFKSLVLEFMSHGSLEEWLHLRADDARKLSFTQRINIATNVASALEYLHHNGPVEVVHCDLKPRNILLDDDMVAHVADFGIAKIFSLNANDSSQSLTKSIVIKGSIGYVAPEYGMGSNVSMQGDVYSYGILLLEMFTRKKPIDDMFMNGFSLHNYAKMALPNRVMDIIDPLMILGETSEELNRMAQRNAIGGLHACLVEIISIGVACSAESPIERMTMSEVINKLHHVMEHYEHGRSNLECKIGIKQ